MSERREYRTLVVPYDFSSHARAALYAAADLARRLGAGLRLLHVVQPPTFGYGYAYGGATPPPIDMAQLRDAAARSLSEVAESIEDVPGNVDCIVVEASNIAGAIRDTAEKLEADLIVMGTHGRTGLAHVFLGSVTERTLRIAPCPVLSVQAPEDDASS